MRTLELDELIYEVSRQSSRVALFLGAGASSSSGIPTASELVKQWRQELYERDQRRGYLENFDDWIQGHEKRYQAWLPQPRPPMLDSDAKRYGYTFQEVALTRKERQERIAKLCSAARPAAGYYALAALIARDVFDTILTTNFDDLLTDACFEVGTVRPQVSAHTETVRMVRLTERRPKIIKLHGDYLFDDLQNTDDELKSLRTGMRDLLLQVNREFGLLVVGYGGNDDSVMGVLEETLGTGNSRGIFWCVRQDTELNERVRRLLGRYSDTFLVRIEGFDEMMVEFFRAVGGDFAALTERVDERSRHVRETLRGFVGPQPAREAVAAARSRLSAWDLVSEGLVLRARGELEGAEAAYRRALELDPKNGMVWNNLGLVLRARGELEEAEAAYQRALELDPKDDAAWNNLGVVLRARGELEEAEAACRRALELDPKDDAAWNNLGLALRARGELEGAEAACRRALELDPKNGPAWNSLGLVLRDRGELEEAEAAYRRALELDPKDDAAWNNLGLALRDRGELEEAEAAHRRAMELASSRPQYADSFFEVGLAHVGLGETQAALAAFRVWCRKTGAPLRSDVVLDLRFMARHNEAARTVLEALSEEGLVPEMAEKRASSDGPSRSFEAAVAFFEQHREELLREYEGKYVAIIDEQIVDSDEDWEALALRVYEKYGYREIYMPKVERTPRVIHIPTPFLLP